MNRPETLTGACLCGAVRYRCTGRALGTVVCHCTECQRASGSAFSVNVAVRRSALDLLGSAPAVFETVGEDSGETRQRFFCAACGSPVYTVAAELPDVAVLKAGTLDDRSWLEPAAEVFAGSAQPWYLRRAPRARLTRGLRVPRVVARAATYGFARWSRG